MNRVRLVCNTGPLIALSLLELLDIDETRGRKMARRIYGLNVVGTARVLVELHKAEQIDRIQPYLEKLVAHGYWLSKTVLSWALSECHENPEPGIG